MKDEETGLYLADVHGCIRGKMAEDAHAEFYDPDDPECEIPFEEASFPVHELDYELCECYSLEECEQKAMEICGGTYHEEAALAYARLAWKHIIKNGCPTHVRGFCDRCSYEDLTYFGGNQDAPRREYPDGRDW
jgi:hypothetical protein